VADIDILRCRDPGHPLEQHQRHADISPRLFSKLYDRAHGLGEEGEAVGLDPRGETGAQAVHPIEDRVHRRVEGKSAGQRRLVLVDRVEEMDVDRTGCRGPLKDRPDCIAIHMLDAHCPDAPYTYFIPLGGKVSAENRDLIEPGARTARWVDRCDHRRTASNQRHEG